MVTVDYDTLHFKVPYGKLNALEQNIDDPSKSRIRIEYSYAKIEIKDGKEQKNRKNSTNSQSFQLGPKRETPIKLKNLKPGERYFISVFIVYEFGIEPDSTSFAVNTTECSTPKHFKVQNKTSTSVNLTWVPPSQCKKKKSNNSTVSFKSINSTNKTDTKDIEQETITTDIKDIEQEPRITYKILYREFSLSNANDENLDSSSVEITNENWTQITNLKPATEYEFIIEAVLSKTSKIISPPPPKIVHNNERSMVKEFTEPAYPENLNVTLSASNKHEAEVKWDAIDSTIDAFKVVYFVKIIQFDYNETACAIAKSGTTPESKSGKDLNKDEDRKEEKDPAGKVLHECEYGTNKTSEYQTSANSIKIRDLHLDALYKFMVKVKTPYGESPFSPPIIRKGSKGMN